MVPQCYVDERLVVGNGGSGATSWATAEGGGGRTRWRRRGVLWVHLSERDRRKRNRSVTGGDCRVVR